MAVTQEVGGRGRPGWGRVRRAPSQNMGAPLTAPRQTAAAPSMGCHIESASVQSSTIESDVPILGETE